MRKRERKIVLGLLIAGLIAAGSWGVSRIVKLRPAGSDTLSAEAPGEGIGRAPAVVRYLGAPEAEEIGTAFQIDTYTEGEGPAPAWWRPDEEMSAEWASGVTDISVGDINVPCNAEPHPPVGIDAGGIDWNLCTDLEGWDGHRMEVWEMDLFSRIVFLEFGITSPECREAGIDAILRLWESGYYSSTMFGTLSAVAENGKPAFSTYPGVWEEEYDYEKLARFREECEERFVNGPEWTAPFFRTGHYHEWAVPCYAFVEDNVYFSTGKGWN